MEQDLKKGGAITRITLTHGKAANLLVHPIETRVRDENGTVLTDLKDSAPTVTHRREGLNEIVTVECALKDQDGRASGLRVKTTLQYRWGYIKIRKEFLAPAGSSRAGGLPAVHRPGPEPLRLRLSGRDHGGGEGPAVFVREQPLGEAASRTSPRTRPSRRATCRVP